MNIIVWMQYFSLNSTPFKTLFSNSIRKSQIFRKFCCPHLPHYQHGKHENQVHWYK
jgi:hypothetical protein